MIDKFCENLSSQSCLLELKESSIGIEKESLRVDEQGKISHKRHPQRLGSSLTNSFITTDYSEALIEMVTPPCKSGKDAIFFLENLHSFVHQGIQEESLWASSMPCIIDGEKSIPIAYYGESNLGRMKTTYRRGLDSRYGRIMQVISGIHYNFSFSENFWLIYREIVKSKENIDDFISKNYFIILRNLLRHGWVLVYLFGCSPAICKSYLDGKRTDLKEFDRFTYYGKYATSLRMGNIGYQNNKEKDMGVIVDYNSLENYIESLKRAITNESSEYKKIGVLKDGYYKQLNSYILQIENEYYSSVRPKSSSKHNINPIRSLKENGVKYIEIRSLDNNIFSPIGIEHDQVHFIELLIIYCLICGSEEITKEEYGLIQENLFGVAHFGRDQDFKINSKGSRNNVIKALEVIFQELEIVANYIDSSLNTSNYIDSLLLQRQKIQNQDLLPSKRVLDKMSKENYSFFELSMELSTDHKKYFKEYQANKKLIDLIKNECKDSVTKQKNIESHDTANFDDFLHNYFSKVIT